MIFPPVFIITGGQGEGKTTVLAEVSEMLMQGNLAVCGFTAPGLWQDNLRSGFDIRNLQTGESRLLCQDHPAAGYVKAGRFYFDTESISLGEKILDAAAPGTLLVIDEVGRFEVQGKIWHDILQSALAKATHPVLMTVRNEFTDMVTGYFGLHEPLIFTIGQGSREIASQAGQRIRQFNTSRPCLNSDMNP